MTSSMFIGYCRGHDILMILLVMLSMRMSVQDSTMEKVMSGQCVMDENKVPMAVLQ